MILKILLLGFFYHFATFFSEEKIWELLNLTISCGSYLYIYTITKYKINIHEALISWHFIEIEVCDRESKHVCVT